MLHIPYIKDNKELVIAGLKKKGVDDVDNKIYIILNLDEQRRWYQKQIDDTRSIVNSNNKKIGFLIKNNDTEAIEKIKWEANSLNKIIRQYEERINEVETELKELLVKLPNIPHTSVPEGKNANDNIQIKAKGEIPKLPDNYLPHWELIKKYDIIDFELGNKITGRGFPVYKGKGAKLQRALINFFLEEAEKAGYQEVQVPILVNEDSGYGTGQLPDKDDQMYFANADKLYLIPTAEVPITNIYRDVIIKPEQLPIKNVGYTPCFRREIGSWGADVKGLNRLHQFDKVEIVQITEPDKSYQALEEMVNHVEDLLNKLKLPYRILKLCGGDMSFTSALTYDFEVYSAVQDKWLEVSSVSNFESFQANRLKLRNKQG